MIVVAMTVLVIVVTMVTFMVIVVMVAIMIVFGVVFVVVSNVLIVIPTVYHKVDARSASIVFITVVALISGISWRNMQINWRAISCYPFNHSWLQINDSRLGITTYIHSAIKSRLTNADRYTNVSSE